MFLPDMSKRFQKSKSIYCKPVSSLRGVLYLSPMIVCLMTTHYDISRAFKDHTSDFLSRTGQLEKRPREIALHVSSESLKHREQNMRIFVSFKYQILYDWLLK